MKSVYILDDHDIVRFGLEMLISASGMFKLLGSSSNLADGLRQIAALEPDILISDLSMDDSKGLDTIRAVVQAQGPRAVLAVSMHDEMLYGEQVLALGARGYVMKEGAHANVVPAALEIAEGRTWVSPMLRERLLSRLRAGSAGVPSSSGTSGAVLTQREIQVMERLGRGKNTKQIASELDLSVRTVDIYRANLKRKLGLRTAAQLIAFSLSRT
ncbi:MAG: response regulator transcription factor [Burkholderiales bacterium]|nr:MAG: response regulator transcription factor [Burkholderiales bacterium]